MLETECLQNLLNLVGLGDTYDAVRQVKVVVHAQMFDQRTFGDIEIGLEADEVIVVKLVAECYDSVVVDMIREFDEIAIMGALVEIAPFLVDELEPIGEVPVDPSFPEESAP